MIKVKDVTKCFGDFKVLDNLNMNVKKGSIYGLIGPNGAGKTTIINHITGVLKQNDGEILIDDKKIFDNANAKYKVINISDEWFYFGTYRIKDMAKFYSDIYPDFSYERYRTISEVFKIDEKTQIKNLSKGMKKQVAFWLSLSAMPDVLILDEPLDGLDPVMRKQTLNLVIQDVSERDLTVLVSSHNLRELEDICDHVGIIHKGKMIVEKPLDDIKGGIRKYQLVFKDDKSEELTNNHFVLNVSHIGSVYTVIIKGEEEETDKFMASLSPSLCEKISLTLEEVFIYELGGLGYDFKNIII